MQQEQMSIRLKNEIRNVVETECPNIQMPTAFLLNMRRQLMVLVRTSPIGGHYLSELISVDRELAKRN